MIKILVKSCGSTILDCVEQLNIRLHIDLVKNSYTLCPQKNAVLVDGMTPGYIGQENCLYMEMKLLMFD